MELLYLIPIGFFLAGVGYLVYTEKIVPAKKATFKIGDFTVTPFKTDRKTGFPALPEGWRWNVSGVDKGRSFEKTILDLVDAKGNVLESEDWYTDVYMTSDSKTKRTLLEGSKKLLRRYKRKLESPLNGIERFYGSYPPKSL